MADEVTIKIRDNGPYIIRGTMIVIDSEGNAFEQQEMIALCRCGHSNTKPFCDGTHKTAGFESAPRAAGGAARARLSPMTRTVYVVPHCHWDREWYQPHELFRWRLVQMIDELLDHMEQHPEYVCFNLDGQSIVIDDYLELRPENEGRLRAMLESGRIVIGPWWVQPDEFLPSGESHIRSFQKGIRFADRLGGSLRVGLCGDQFGHIAQMPQIMSQLGLTSATLWRGVPDSVPGWSFHWEAPDGTRLPVLYLRNSYSSGWRLPSEPDDLVERTRRQERELPDGAPAVLMNGTDHSRMEKHVPAALAAAAGRGYDYKLGTLADYQRAVFEAGIDEHVHVGELRSPDRSNVLVGVLSARVNIKQRDFEVSRALERYAEPLELLCYLHHGPDGTPALRHAWRLLLENSPHDSICGCSVDQTHREMFPRYDRAEQLANEIARESMGHLVSRLEVPDGGGLAVFRAVPHAAATLDAMVPESWAAFDQVRLPNGSTVPFSLEPASPERTLAHHEVTPQGAVRHLDFIREGRFDNHYVEDMRWELEGRHLKVETTVGQGLCVVDEQTVRDEVRNIAANNLADTAEVKVTLSATAKLRAVLPASDTVGVELLVPHHAPPIVPAGPAPTGKADLANEFYELRLRKGRLSIRDWQHGVDLENVNAFVDEGDRGDEYNADILADAVTRPVACEVLSVTSDNVSGTLRYLTLLEIPAGLTAKRKRRRKSTVVLPILTEVTLWSGLPRVDFRVTVQNVAERPPPASAVPAAVFDRHGDHGEPVPRGRAVADAAGVERREPGAAADDVPAEDVRRVRRRGSRAGGVQPGTAGRRGGAGRVGPPGVCAHAAALCRLAIAAGPGVAARWRGPDDRDRGQPDARRARLRIRADDVPGRVGAARACSRWRTASRTRRSRGRPTSTRGRMRARCRWPGSPPRRWCRRRCTGATSTARQSCGFTTARGLPDRRRLRCRRLVGAQA